MTRSVALLTIALAIAPAVRAQQSLTLERAIALALERNERAAVADARVDAAEARVGRARAFFFPDVTLTGNYTRRSYETMREIGGDIVTIQSKNAFNANAFLSTTLFNARAFPLYRQAKLERESTRLGSAEDKRLLQFEAADAYVITLSLERVLQAAARRRDFAKASLDDSRARFEAGLVSSNDVTRAELELATAEREVTRTRGQVQTAYLELGNLLNTEVEGPLDVPENLLAAASESRTIPDAVIAEAEMRRLDIGSTERHALALEEFAKEPLQRFIPNLVMNGQYRHTNEAGLSGREDDSSLGLVLTWNAFDGGEAFADRAERRALAREARLDLEADRRRVGLEVRSAETALSSEQASIRQATIAVEAARKNADESTELYRQGLASALEVADANFRLFEAEVAEARARYQLALAYLDLRLALGHEPL
ncbi:MAG TPA: TolC family protein [Thermoanaerobaculia bacterium]